MWYKWKELWNANGGDFFYACWKLTYQEDYFQHEVNRILGYGYEIVHNACIQ